MWQERSVRWFTGACEKREGREIGDEGRDRGLQGGMQEPEGRRTLKKPVGETDWL